MKFLLENNILTYKEQENQKYIQWQEGMRSVALFKVTLLPHNTFREQFAAMTYVIFNYARVVVSFRPPHIGIDNISQLKDYEK